MAFDRPFTLTLAVVRNGQVPSRGWAGAWAGDKDETRVKATRKRLAGVGEAGLCNGVISRPGTPWLATE
jgi:hypothetical protein